VRKINGIFDCELEPTGICRFDDEQDIGLNIRKCPTGKTNKEIFLDDTSIIRWQRLE
jgi:hypothetical protein